MMTWLFLLATPCIDLPTSVMPEEMDEARTWTAAKFEGIAEAPSPKVGLNVLANHGPVQKNARAQYVVVDIDAPETKKHFTSQELMETGLLVVVSDQPGAFIITYKRR